MYLNQFNKLIKQHQLFIKNLNQTIKFWLKEKRRLVAYGKVTLVLGSDGLHSYFKYFDSKNE